MRRSSRPHRRRWFRRRPTGDDGAGWLLIEHEYGASIVESPPPMTEQVRYIVERLRLQDAEGLPTRIGVTSALGGEGAATVARTLAGVLAGEADRMIGLVSLDWWTADAPLGDVPGVAQVVSGHVETADVLLRTSVPRLAYVPAGHAEPAALPALVRSGAFASVLRELALRFNHLVLELPPVRVTSEALALAGHCDVCALVVRQGATSRNDVRAAIDSLGQERLLGVIMNQASTKVPEFLLRAVAPS